MRVLFLQLDHPNIMKIVEAYEDANNITTIMELLSGQEPSICIDDDCMRRKDTHFSSASTCARRKSL